MGSTDVERPKLRSCEFFRTEYATGRDRVGLAEELNRDRDALDLTDPSEAGVALDEATFLEVVL
jgi:hypothetical protein